MYYKLVKIFFVLLLAIIFNGCYTIIRILENDRRIGSTGKINVEDIRGKEFFIEDNDRYRGYYYLDIYFDPIDIELLRALHHLEEPVNFEFDLLIKQGNNEIKKHFQYYIDAIIAKRDIVLFHMPTDVKYDRKEKIYIYIHSILIDKNMESDTEYYKTIMFYISKANFTYMD